MTSWKNRKERSARLAREECRKRRLYGIWNVAQGNCKLSVRQGSQINFVPVSFVCSVRMELLFVSDRQTYVSHPISRVTTATLVTFYGRRKRYFSGSARAWHGFQMEGRYVREENPSPTHPPWQDPYQSPIDPQIHLLPSHCLIGGVVSSSISLPVD